MAKWIPILKSEIDLDSPIAESLAMAMRDNFRQVYTYPIDPSVYDVQLVTYEDEHDANPFWRNLND